MLVLLHYSRRDGIDAPPFLRYRVLRHFFFSRHADHLPPLLIAIAAYLPSTSRYTFDAARAAYSTYNSVTPSPLAIPRGRIREPLRQASARRSSL